MNMNKINLKSLFFLTLIIVFTLFKCYNYHSGDSYEKILKVYNDNSNVGINDKCCSN